jgi:hypothetical protein
MILYIAHSLMGMWGMFLGVPMSVYIYRYMIQGGKVELSAGNAPVGATPLLGESEDSPADPAKEKVEEKEGKAP